MTTTLKIKAYVSSNAGWSKVSYKSSFLWIKGYFYNTDPKRILIALFEKQNNLSEIKRILNTIDGHYGLIYQNRGIAIISVDKISSIPIYYLHDKNKKIYYVYSNSLNSSKKTNASPRPIVNWKAIVLNIKTAVFFNVSQNICLVLLDLSARRFKH